MTEMFKYLVCDYKKTKHLPFRMAHLIIPVTAAVLFLVYYAASPWNERVKSEAYFETLGCAFPILIGLFCAMTAEQEAQAASYQAMLSAVKRVPVFFGKLILLAASGTFSVFLAGILFGLGNMYIIKQSVTGMRFYLEVSFAIASGSLILYIFHLFLSLRFNKGVSIIIGIAESITGALMLTGIGEHIWCYIPCAWGIRWVPLVLSSSMGEHVSDTKCMTAVILCVVLTAGAAFLFGIWACRWEGWHASD